MGRLRVRDVLNEIKWSGKYRASDVEIYFVSRGHRNNIEKVLFTDVLELRRGSIIVRSNHEEKYIPHHRILRIAKVSGEIIWSK
jgi:uncharacterized protein (UPF0248 family)